MADIIKVEHLSYVYNPGMPNAVTALDDVSFTVEEGDFVGIIGATGSGKSTLITHMNGLNKPTSGKIYIDGRDLWEDPVAVEKISTAAPGSYDLVLMDVQMPVMDGYTATRQIRALGDPALAKIPILAMTANAFDEDRRNALESGMTGFLSKPIVIGDLVQELRKIL